MNLVEFRKKYPALPKTTLCFLVKEDKVLLAMKKRGLGVGLWNGVGGKLNKNESVEEAAIREAKEEIGVIVKSLEQKAIMNFYFVPNPDWNQQVLVYLVKEWEGEPIETEEMAPKWFKKKEIPLDKMWIDDKYWLPRVLNGEKIKAGFLLDKIDNMVEYNVSSV